MTVAVSVILPTFNRSDSLKRAIESVLIQSFQDLELIVVDDASTEDIWAIVSAFNDERLRYVRHSNNGGASVARNTGLALAKGEYIAFQDSDDLWLPEKLSRQLEMFDILPEDVGVVCGSKILYGRDAQHNYGSGRVACAPPPENRLALDEDQVRRFLDGNRISLQNAIFRRNCFPDAVWFDPCAKANADWEFTARLAQHTRIYEDTEPVVLAFISSDSISTNFRKKALGLIRILKKNKQVFKNYPDVHAKNLIKLSQLMWRLGRKRFSQRLIIAALIKNPSSSLTILASIGIKRLRSILKIR